MSMSSRDMSGSSAFSASSCTLAWKMSTGGTQALVGTHLTYSTGFLFGLGVFSVDDFSILDGV